MLLREFFKPPSLIATIIFAFCSAAKADTNPPPLKPLREFVKTNDVLNDVSNMLYLIDRCQALLLSSREMMANETNEEAKAAVKAIDDAGMVYGIASVKMLKRQNVDVDTALQKHNETIKQLLTIYRKYWGQVSLVGDDLAQNSLYLDDNNICSVVKSDILKGNIK